MNTQSAQEVADLLTHLNSAVHSRRTTLRVPASDGVRLVLIASAGEGESAVRDVGVDDDKGMAIAFRSNEMVVVEDYPSYQHAMQAAIDDGIISGVYLPVRHGDKTLGVLTIASREAGAFSSEVIAVLDAYALALGELLNRIALSERLEVTAEIGRIASSDFGIEEVYTRFSDAVQKIVDFDRIVICTLGDDPETFDHAYVHGTHVPGRETGNSFQVQGSFLGDVIKAGEPIVLCAESEAQLNELQPSLSSLFNAGLRSWIGTPLFADDRAFAVLIVATSAIQAYTSEQADHLAAIGNQIAGAIANAMAVKKVEESVATSDVLLEDAPQGVIVADNTGMIIRVNRQLEILFGFSREELVGNQVEVLIPESMRRNHIALRSEYAKNPVSRIMGEGLRLSGRRKDGSEFPVEIGLSSIETSVGRLTIAHVMDDTNRRELEEFLTATGMELGDKLEAREAEIELVDQVAGLITSTIDIDQIFANFANGVRNLVEFDHTAVNVIDKEAGALITQHFTWSGKLTTGPRLATDLEGTLTEKTSLTGRTVIENDFGKNPGYSSDDYFIDHGLRSSVMTPLIYKDTVIGSISLSSKIPNSYGTREQLLLERLAGQIAPAVEAARLYEESVARNAQLECLLNIAEILGQAIPFERKVVKMLEQLVEVTGSYSARLRLPDPSGQKLMLTASAGTVDAPGLIRPDFVGKETLAFQVFQSGTPMVIVDYQNHPDASPLLEDMGDRSVVLLPIAAGGKPAAMVSVDAVELNHFTPERVRLLTSIGEGLGNLLENDRLAEELRSSTQQMGLVDEVAKIMTSTLDIDRIYDSFASEVKKLINFDRATLMEVQYRTNTYTIQNTWGLGVPFLDTGRDLPLENSFIERAMATGTWAITSEIDRIPDTPGYSYLIEAGLKSQVLAPLTSNDLVIGVLALSSTRADAFGPREQAILERLASQITPAVENARLYRQAQERNQEIQRLSESTTRILESNPSALVVLRGADREVVMVNSSFRSTFSLDESRIEGQPLSQVLDWAGMEEWILESLLSPSGEGQREMTYPGQNEDERWFLVSAVPLQAIDDAASEEEILLVLNDITEQKQQQEMLQGHSRLASVGELAAGVAHEINNPLAAILGLSELIQMEALAPQITEDAAKIQEAAQRAARIVQNLLSFARKQAPEKSYLDIASVADRAVELKSHDFRQENIQITVRHSNRVPSTMMDDLQIIQVILNILTNAEQAIAENQGSGKITLTTQLVKGKIHVSIADDGPGIPADTLPNIFNPFFTTKQVGQGTGLGLSICYGIIREHGGELWAESRRGKGAVFHFELPVASQAVRDDTRTTDRFAGSVSGSAGKKRILVVDDEPIFRDTMFRMLTADEHDVSLAEDGNDAWQLIRKDQFDLILTDLKMPGMDGQKLYERVQEMSPDLAGQMVFITGDTASANAMNFLGSTTNPVLRKPFNISDVRRLIEALDVPAS